MASGASTRTPSARDPRMHPRAEAMKPDLGAETGPSGCPRQPGNSHQAPRRVADRTDQPGRTTEQSRRLALRLPKPQSKQRRGAILPWPGHGVGWLRFADGACPSGDDARAAAALVPERGQPRADSPEAPVVAIEEGTEGRRARRRAGRAGRWCRWRRSGGTASVAGHGVANDRRIGHERRVGGHRARPGTTGAVLVASLSSYGPPPGTLLRQIRATTACRAITRSRSSLVGLRPGRRVRPGTGGGSVAADPPGRRRCHRGTG